MATLSIVILPAKALKGGRHKIRIAVAHNSVTRYLNTDVVIDSAKEFKNGMVVKRPDAAYLNSKLRKIVNEYQKKIDTVESLSCITCVQLIGLLKQDDHQYSLEEIADELLKVSSAKESTKEQIRYAHNILFRHIDKSRLVKTITHNDVNNLFDALKKLNLAHSTLIRYMAALRQILKYSKAHGYANYTIDPFIDYVAPNASVRDSWLTVEEIKQLRDGVLKHRADRRNRDLVMLSYYLGGINMADLVKINFNECNGVLKYERQKTDRRNKINKYVEFAIPDEAYPLIAQHINSEGYIKYNFTTLNNGSFRFLHRISTELGLKNDLIYYSARKSFAQHAFELGVPTQVIDYILGHSLKKGGSCLYAYIGVTPQMATDAIRKVLDNLK